MFFVVDFMYHLWWIKPHSNLEMFHNFMSTIVWHFSFTLCRFHNISSYWKYKYFCPRRKFYRKSTISQSWKLSNSTIWLKLNRKNSGHKKLFNLAKCARVIFALRLWERLWRFKRPQSWSLQETLTSCNKKLFSQTIADKINENESKLERARNFDICFCAIFDH